MGKKQEDPGVEGAPEWVTTFVDMISLLVTFFILLFTFSSMEDYSRFHFPQNVGGYPNAIESEGGGSSSVEAPADDLMSAMHPTQGSPNPHTRPPDALTENQEEMGQKKDESDIELDLSSARDEIVVHFNASASFAPGSVDVTPELRRSLDQLAGVLQAYSHPIVFEGHTDSHFKASTRYPTAEALSCARAVESARVLLAAGRIDAARVRIAGLGSTRPLNQNATALERTENRRVEVRILPPEGAITDRGN